MGGRSKRCMIKLPKFEAHMDRYRPILFCLVLSAVIAAASAHESAWAKDGNSGSGNSGSGGSGSGGSGGNSGKGGGTSGKGKSGEGSGAGSSTVGSIVSSIENPNSETVGRTHAIRSSTLATRARAKKKPVFSTT